jgi:Mrp family chromosome partitioning ATPase
MTALNKEAPIEEACYKIGSDSLAMIPAGAPGQAHDIFSTEAGVNGLKKEIDQLRQSFKFIIIDAPPVIPYVDPTLLAGAADGVAVVVEANNTRAEVLDRACDRLKRSKANIWGMILNKREFHIPGWIYRFL